VLQVDLDIINTWFSDWLLCLNTKKCKVLHYGNKTQSSDKFKDNINGQNLEETITENDLGVYFSHDFNWDNKESQICSKSNFWSQNVSY